MLVITSIAISVNAQIKVFTGNNIAIGGTSFTPNSCLTIGSGSSALGNSAYKAFIYNSSTSNNSTGIYINQAAANNSYHTYGINSFDTTGNSGCYAIGISGTATKSVYLSHGVHYGVYGEAGNATSGYNYGVFGQLSASNGAGVYGASRGNGATNTGGNYAGFFYGDVKITNYTNTATLTVNSSTYTSDQRLKKNITPLTNSLFNKISQLNAVQFQYKTRKELKTAGLIPADTSKSDTVNINSNKIRYGYLAQDVQKIFPDIVYQGSDGFLGIDYVELIPLMMEVLKQQNATIASMQQQINNCCSKGSNQKTTGNNNTDPSTDVELVSNSAILYQNMPNPFGDGTVVKYFVPENVTTASIIFYDEFGTEIKNIELPNKGITAVLNLSTLNLASGIYSYSLIVNGKVIDTKKMMKTK